MTDAQNVFLFVFATMMLALVVELWAIAKILQRICETLTHQNELQESKETHVNQKQEGISQL